MKQIIAIYSRKSKQTETGDSIANQIQMCKDYIMSTRDKNNIQFIVYEDEGFSGGNINRPKFQKLIKDVKDKKIDIVICYRLDRTSRNISDFSTFIELLNKFDVGFISLKEQFDTTTPMGRAMMYIASVFAQLERETIAERVRDNMVELAKTGRWLGGGFPTGYESEEVITVIEDGNTKRLHKLRQLKDEISLVTLIFQKYLEYNSLTKTTKYFIENSIMSRDGNDFSLTTIRQILTSPIYCMANENVYNYLKDKCNLFSKKEEFDGIHGLVAYNKSNKIKGRKPMSEWILSMAEHEGIIDGDDWIYIQEKLIENKSNISIPIRASGQLSILSGLVKCKCCGSLLRPKGHNRVDKDGKAVFYYICKMKENSRTKRCNVKNINGSDLDKLVLDEIGKLTMENSPLMLNIKNSKSAIKEIASVNSQKIRELENKINEKSVKLTNCIELVGKLGINTPKSITDEISQLDEAVTLLTKDLKKIQLNSEEDELNDRNYNLFKESLLVLKDVNIDVIDKNSLRKMLDSILKEIVWDGETAELVLQYHNSFDEEENSSKSGNDNVNLLPNPMCSR